MLRRFICKHLSKEISFTVRL